MADAKISALTSLTGAGAAQDDLLAIVDTSAATTKKITREEFFKSVDYISFDTTNVVASPTEGQLTWDTAEKTLSLGLNGGDTVLQVGQETHYRVRNNSGTQIPDGTVVRFSGVLGSSGIITVVPALADGTYPSSYIIGVTTENISHGADGLVAAFGKVRGIDTSAFAVGDVLYASPTVAGGFTTRKPSTSQNIVSIAAVLSSHANNGVIFVRPHVEDEAPVLDRLGRKSLRPFVVVVEGQSNALGSGTGQNTIIDQSGGGIFIYSSLAGGGSGSMVQAAYGTAPLNRTMAGGTTTDPALSVGNIGPHLANQLRAIGAVHPDRPIWIVVNAVGGINISEWIDSPFTRHTAFEAAMQRISTIYGDTLQVDHLHWQQGEANSTTAPPYNTNETYFAALGTWLEQKKGSVYWSDSTTVTMGEILTERPYIDTGAVYRTAANARNPAIRQFANDYLNPLVGLVPSSGIPRNGINPDDANHFSGAGLAEIGKRAANRFMGLRTGTASGAEQLSSGRALITYPQLSFTNESVLLGADDLSAGHLFLRCANADVTLPVIEVGSNPVIRLEVWSVSGGNTEINMPSGLFLDGPDGLVTSASLGLGNYEFWYSGRWRYTSVGPKMGDMLYGVLPSMTMGEVRGLTTQNARSNVLNVFGGGQVGLPTPVQGSHLTLILRSVTGGSTVLGRAVNGVLIANAGTGYAVGDTITLDIGSATGTAPTVTVSSVGAGGSITGITTTQPGCITSSTLPPSPNTPVSTSGSGINATFTVTYASALINGPKPGDTATSYTLSTVNQIVDLVAIGPNWWVLSDSATDARATRGTFTPTLGNSVSGDLSVAYTSQSGSWERVGNMLYISGEMTFTATHTTASGYWKVEGITPLTTSSTGWSLLVRHSSAITTPSGQSTVVGVSDASGSFRLRTASHNQDLPVANITSGASASLSFSGVIQLTA